MTMLSFRHVAVAGLALLVLAAACAPEATPQTPAPGAAGTPMAGATPTRPIAALATPAAVGTPTVVAGAATTPEMQRAIQDMQALQRQLQQLRDAVGQAQNIDAGRFNGMLAATTGSFGDLMSELDGAMQQATPEERDRADDSLRRMRERVEGMNRTLAAAATPTAAATMPADATATPADTMATPTAVATATPLTLGRISQDLGQVQQAIRQQGGQLDTNQQQEIISQLSGLAGDTGELLDRATPVLSRTSSDQQQRIVSRIGDINKQVQEMLQAAGQPTPTPTAMP